MIKFLFWGLLTINISAQLNSSHITDNDSSNNFIDTLNNVSQNPDTLIPIFTEPLNNFSSFIYSERIKNTNYRYFGDIVSLSSIPNIKNYGFVGYPNELNLYGNALNTVSILKDGLQINARQVNYFNLNMIQTEEIDSVEIIPLPRGALYSSFIFPTSINIITKDFFPAEPYSRIKYYQGPDRESFINGYFNAEVLKKFFFTFSITNRIKDATFVNSDFSIWQGNIKLKYLLSNKFNFVFSYDISDYKLGFNGGVNYDSVLKLTTKPNDLLYDPIAAPVYLPKGKIEMYSQMPRLTIKSKFIEQLKSDLSIFFLFNKSEHKTFYYNYLEQKVLGIHLDNRLSFDNLEFGLLLDYEKINDYINREIKPGAPNVLPPGSCIIKNNSSLFTYGGYLNIKSFSKNINYSIFFKNSNLYNTISRFFPFFREPYPVNIILGDYSSASAGMDLNYNVNENISIYIGYSIIGKYLQKKELDDLLFETSITYKGNFINANLRYFINEQKSSTYSTPSALNIDYDNAFGDVSGISSEIRFKQKFILIESINSYYWKSDKEKLYNIPEYSSRNGIYYYDFLFDSNLEMKVGFQLNFIGNQITFPENQPGIIPININPVQTIDFILSGTIQNTATLFFTWENLLNKKYFFIPYFPMPERNIRFGVSWEFLN